MKRLTPEELADTITDFVNSFGSDNKAFIEAFKKQHRTLQQSTIRLFLETVEAVADQSYRTDGRNEASHEVCKQVVEGFKNIRREKDGQYFMNTGPSKYLGYI